MSIALAAAAAAAAAASVERAETTGEVEATGPVVEVRSYCYLMSTYHYSQDNTHWKPNLNLSEQGCHEKDFAKPQEALHEEAAAAEEATAGPSGRAGAHRSGG